MILAAEEHRFMVRRQLAEAHLQPHSIWLEPQSKNTAASICLATLAIAQTQPEALMLVMPTDHLMTDEAAFAQSVNAAIPAAEEGKIVCFAVTPTRPETGYGWLEWQGVKPSALKVQPLASFTEKPNAATAQRFLDGGKHAWNAGIFLFRADRILQLFEALQPALLLQVKAAYAAHSHDASFLRPDAQAWATLPDLSLDVAVMQNAPCLHAIALDAGWSDLGDWEGFYREMQSHPALFELPQALAMDCTDSLLLPSTPEQALVAIGLHNLVVVATPDAVLVADRQRSQELRHVVTLLQQRGTMQATQHPRQYRPWGWYECIARGEGFQVKLLEVSCGASLSLQRHTHRAEQWVVLSGSAEVTRGDEVIRLHSHEAIAIPRSTKHRLANPSANLPLRIIEVQSGDYLGEDDIMRYEDAYARDVCDEENSAG
jgi:mannose-1-phosphate guanylyltransferase / mannose-6-phosphate isomerase